MLTRLRQRLTYANVMATIAVFIALGGSGYAAVTLKKNSVKGKHLAKNSVTSPKVKNRSLKRKDFARGQLPKGAHGDQGAKGDQGPPGPGEEAAVTYSAPDANPATVKTLIFAGDGLILKASCGGAGGNHNLNLWADSTVDNGILTWTRISGNAVTETRNYDLDPNSEYAFGGVSQSTAGAGTISWVTPSGAQVSGTWHGNGPGTTLPCRFDALLLRHH
jgi:hypothetical protein